MWRIQLKKITILILFSLFCATHGFSMSAGTGFSVFVPESLYLYGDGSVSMEQSLQFSLGLTDIISVPIGVTYNTNYGLMVNNEPDVSGAWFYSDSIMPYILVKAHIPVGKVYFEFFGGGAVNYNFTLRPLEGNIEEDLSVGGNQAVILDDSLEFEKSVGFGYLAGGSIGVTFGDISVDITVQYRSIWHKLNFSGEFHPASGVSPGQKFESDANLIMRGLSIGLGGSFKF